ncbi:hypothetical protein ACFLUK_01545 [Chloroflexota bacterium]
MLRYIPELLAWLVGVILAVAMVRRGGGKAEKLFLAGCSLMFATRLATPLLSELVHLLMLERDMSNIDIAQTMGLAVNLPISILTVAGLVCLVWAFWVRFRGERRVTT